MFGCFRFLPRRSLWLRRMPEPSIVQDKSDPVILSSIPTEESCGNSAAICRICTYTESLLFLLVNFLKTACTSGSFKGLASIVLVSWVFSCFATFVSFLVFWRFCLSWAKIARSESFTTTSFDTMKLLSLSMGRAEETSFFCLWGCLASFCVMGKPEKEGDRRGSKSEPCRR